MSSQVTLAEASGANSLIKVVLFLPFVKASHWWEPRSHYYTQMLPMLNLGELLFSLADTVSSRWN